MSYGNIKKPMSVSRLGILLGTVGYHAVRRRTGNVLTRGWIVYQRDTDEINALKKTIKRTSVTPVTANFYIYIPAYG